MIMVCIESNIILKILIEEIFLKEMDFHILNVEENAFIKCIIKHLIVFPIRLFRRIKL